VSVPITLSDLERRDAKGHTFPEDRCNYIRTNRFAYKTTKCAKVKPLGQEQVLGAKHPILRGGFQSPQNFGTPILTPIPCDQRRNLARWQV